MKIPIKPLILATIIPTQIQIPSRIYQLPGIYHQLKKKKPEPDTHQLAAIIPGVERQPAHLITPQTYQPHCPLPLKSRLLLQLIMVVSKNTHRPCCISIILKRKQLVQDNICFPHAIQNHFIKSPNIPEHTHKNGFPAK
jgi:hypothetical protein